MKIEKEITIYDIASQLGIAPSTVSRALNDNPTISASTRKKINALAEKLGYQHNPFARSLRMQKTHTIGVIFHELNSYFITSVLAGIEKIAREAKYNLIIVHSGESAKLEAANANNLFHKRVDGVIASLSFDTEDLSHFKQFQSKNIPIVFFDRVFENGDGTKIIINNMQAGYDATAHLIEQGCRRIAHITSSLKRNVYAERMRGYKQALLDHKLITNDFCAAVIMQALKDAGIRIPQDIAVVGFNNDIIGKVISPKLTTINYPGFEMGQVAARSLINHLKGLWDMSLTNTVVIKSELII